MAAARTRRLAKRGFTLVELMVAISTGMTVALAAFLLAKVSLGSFQQDARVNNAQHSAVMAMNRLVADVKRAGFMSTPDASSDNNICQRNSLPTNQRALLIGANVFEGKAGGGNFYNVAAYGTTPNNTLPVLATGPENNRQPDRLRIAGNFMTTERLIFRSVNEGSNTINLAVDTNAMQRIFRDSPAGGQTACRLFPNNRILRLVDAKKMDSYVRIASCSETMAGSYLGSVTIVYTNFAGSLPRVSGVCGVAEGNAGGTVNTVNVVEYSVQQVAPGTLGVHGLQASMASIVGWDAALAPTTGEDTRMDLLRREIDATGAVVANSGEVIAEWVADFKLRAWFTQGTGEILSGRLFDTGFDKEDASPGAEPPPPQRIRSLGIRLTTRSREPDRERRLGAAAPGPTAPLDRFEVFPTSTPRKNRMARVRTMYTEVSLPNLTHASW